MKRLIGLIGASLFLLLALIGCGGSLFAPSPEQYAAATATLMRAQSIANADAVQNEARATAIFGESQATATAAWAGANATVTAMAQSASATATIAPIVVGRIDNQARASNVGDWVWLGVFGTLGAAVVLLVFAFGGMVRTRGTMLPRSRDGQMQPVLIHGTVIDPQRMIGPAATAPQAPGWMDQLARLLEWRKTGQLPAAPEPHALLSDGGADADHYLAAAESANQATATAALMRPDQADAARKQRLEIMTKNAGPGLLGGGSSITRVVGVGDSAVDAFARAIAHDMGDHIVPAAPATVVDPALSSGVNVLPGNDATTPRLELTVDAGAPVSDEEWAASKPQETG